MIRTCAYENTVPFHFCYNCSLFLETCAPIISKDGYCRGSECADLYVCSKCNEDCLYKSFINQ